MVKFILGLTAVVLLSLAASAQEPPKLADPVAPKEAIPEAKRSQVTLAKLKRELSSLQLREKSLLEVLAETHPIVQDAREKQKQVEDRIQALIASDPKTPGPKNTVPESPLPAPPELAPREGNVPASIEADRKTIEGLWLLPAAKERNPVVLRIHNGWMYVCKFGEPANPITSYSGPCKLQLTKNGKRAIGTSDINTHGETQQQLLLYELQGDTLKLDGELNDKKNKHVMDGKWQRIGTANQVEIPGKVEERKVFKPEQIEKDSPKVVVTVALQVESVSRLRGPIAEGQPPHEPIKLDATAKLKDERNKLYVVLLGKALTQVHQLGIDPVAHFQGRSIEVTGKVQYHTLPQITRDGKVEVPADSYTHYEVVVDSLDNFRVVENVAEEVEVDPKAANLQDLTHAAAAKLGIMIEVKEIKPKVNFVTIKFSQPPSVALLAIHSNKDDWIANTELSVKGKSCSVWLVEDFTARSYYLIRTSDGKRQYRIPIRESGNGKPKPRVEPTSGAPTLNNTGTSDLRTLLSFLGNAAARYGEDRNVLRPALLTIGSPAPEFKVDTWVKGNPVSGIEQGKVYVVEFWGTSCAPCIKCMPHLSDLQRQYKEVTFVCLSDEHRNTIQEFVEKNDKNMGFRVGWDEKGRMWNSWMEAAEIQSIPTAFIVDATGKIAWIGSPEKVDEPLKQVLNGTFDPRFDTLRLRLDAAYKKLQKTETERLDRYNTLAGKVEELIQQRKWDVARLMVEEASRNPKLDGHSLRFLMLLVIASNPATVDEAMEFAINLATVTRSIGGHDSVCHSQSYLYLAQIVMRGHNTSSDAGFPELALALADWAVDDLQRMPEQRGRLEFEYDIHQLQASAHAARHRYAKAIVHQEAALSLLPRIVPSNRIKDWRPIEETQLKATLKQYREGLVEVGKSK